MKWSSLSAKDRRAIVTGAAVLLPSLGYVWGVRPYRAHMEDLRDHLVTERAALSREQAALATSPANPDAQRVADSSLAAVSARLFAGRDDAIAGSQLASYLGDVARRNRVLMQDASTRPSSVSPEGIRTLRVEIRAESDIQGVTAFLQGLERGRKLVRVDRLEISKVPGLEEKNGYETLTIAATVSGFAFDAAPADSAKLYAPRGAR